MNENILFKYLMKFDSTYFNFSDKLYILYHHKLMLVINSAFSIITSWLSKVNNQIYQMFLHQFFNHFFIDSKFLLYYDINNLNSDL